MSEFSEFNFGELIKSAGSFEMVPKGKQIVRVENAEPKKTNSGKLMYSLRFRIQGGAHNNRTLYGNIVLTTDNPNALRMFFVNMKAFGIDEKVFATNPTPEQVADMLVGKIVEATIDHREYQGQEREDIRGYKAVSAQQVAQASAPNPMAPVGMPAAAAPRPVQQAPVVAAPVVAAPQPVAPAAAPVENNYPIPVPQNPVVEQPEPAYVSPVEAPAPAPAPVAEAPAPAPVAQPEPAATPVAAAPAGMPKLPF